MKKVGLLALRNALLFPAVLLSLLLTACADLGETNVKSGTRDQVLHLGNGTEPQDLDPHTVSGVTEHNIISALLEGLVSEEPRTLAPVPGVAKSWDISEDLKTYTFHIRHDARWSNGDPVTAQDFIYSWERLLTPTLAAVYAYQLFVVKNAEAFNKGEIDDFNLVGVKADGPHTLIVELNNPAPYFLSLLVHYSTFPVHRPTIEKFGTMDERSTLWTRPGNFVGNGPFALTEWALNRIITLKKNPYYWDADMVRLQEIRFYPIENYTTEERMFRAGTLHVTNIIPAEKIAVYQDKQPHLIAIAAYLGTYYYRFNVTRKPFDDVRVRRAFSMSIDRQKLVEAVTKGGQIPAFTFTPPDTQGYTAEPYIRYDIAAARALLAEAGYPEGEGFPPVEILYNTSEGHRKIAVAFQQMWKEALGVEVGLVNQDWKVYLSRMKTLDYDIARAGWIGDYVDPNSFLDMFVTDGGNNQTGWSNQEYDRLIRKASEAADQSERYQFFQEAEAVLMAESPIMPIYTYTSQALRSPDVKGWYDTILDHHPYKYVYLEAQE